MPYLGFYIYIFRTYNILNIINVTIITEFKVISNTLLLIYIL